MPHDACRALRQAAAWGPHFEADDRLQDFAELVLEVTACREAEIRRFAHELAAACRLADLDTALNDMLRDHNRRAAFGVRALPPLSAKARDCRDALAGRWIAACGWKLRQPTSRSTR